MNHLRQIALAVLVVLIAAEWSLAVITQQSRRPTKRARDRAPRDEIDLRAQALLLSAKLHFARGEFSKGKAFLAEAIEADPSLDNLETRALNMMHPDFPFITLPELSYTRRSVSFSQNGTYASFFRDSVVRQNIVTGEIESFQTEPHGYCLLSPTGRYLTAYYFRSIFLFDCEDNSLVGSLIPPDGRFGETPILAFSADESEVAMYIVADDDNANIQFRSIHDFKLVDELDVGKLFPTARIYSLQYLNNKSKLIIGRLDEAVVVDRTSKKLLQSFPTNDRTWCLDLTSDESLLACGGAEVIHVYDVQTGTSVLKFHACTHNVNGVGFLLGRRFVVWSSAKRAGGVVDVATGDRVHDFVYPDGTTMAVNRSRLLMAVGGEVVDLRRLGQLVDHPDAGLLHPKQDLKTPDSFPESVVTLYEKIKKTNRRRLRWQSTSPSGKWKAYATDGGDVFVLDRKNGDIQSLSSNWWNTAGMAFLGGDRKLLRLGRSNNGMVGAVQVFDIEAQKAEEEVRLFDPPSSQAISPDEKYAVVVDRANRVWLFDLTDLQNHVALLDPIDEEREARFSKNGNRLIIRTGETWRKYDFRLISQKPAFSASDFGYQIEGLKLQRGGRPLRR